MHPWVGLAWRRIWDRVQEQQQKYRAAPEIGIIGTTPEWQITPYNVYPYGGQSIQSSTLRTKRRGGEDTTRVELIDGWYGLPLYICVHTRYFAFYWITLSRGQLPYSVCPWKSFITEYAYGVSEYNYSVQRTAYIPQESAVWGASCWKWLNRSRLVRAGYTAANQQHKVDPPSEIGAVQERIVHRSSAFDTHSPLFPYFIMGKVSLPSRSTADCPAGRSMAPNSTLTECSDSVQHHRPRDTPLYDSTSKLIGCGCSCSPSDAFLVCL